VLALDTNTVIYFFKAMGRAAENLRKEASCDIAIPAVVLY
jgi:rRNA-processing protein FCF1